MSFDACASSAPGTLAHPSLRRPLLLDRLRAEWRVLSTRRNAIARVRTWSLPDDIGTSVRSLDDLLVRAGYRDEGAGSSPTSDAEDACLLALVAVARDDELAARVVLQRILPGLAGVARRTTSSWADRQELLDDLVANAWLRIRSYPVERRPRRVASNLVRDVGYATCVQPLRRKLASERVTAPHLLLETPIDERTEPLDELAAVLRDARANGLAADDHGLLCLLAAMPYVGDVATALDVTARTVRNRRDLAIARLRRLTEAAA